jgi:hypothetical protein
MVSIKPSNASRRKRCTSVFAYIILQPGDDVWCLDALAARSSSQLNTVSSYTTPVFGYSLPQDIVAAASASHILDREQPSV